MYARDLGLASVVVEWWFAALVTQYGCYGDGRTFALPDDWTAVENEVLETARAQTLAALAGEAAIDRLARYYDRDGSYAGTTFLDAEPNNPDSVEASDLYAVTTLSMKLDARQGRLLLDDGAVRAGVRQQLCEIDPTLPLTDLELGEGGAAETLQRMYELHRRFRTLLKEDSNRWVFAAKLCARKRPRLFPVRDNLVCEYLAGGRRLKSGDGWPGDFSVDIQVYANLATTREVRSGLKRLRAELTGKRGVRLDEEDLRLLDSVLWMAASRP